LPGFDRERGAEVVAERGNPCVVVDDVIDEVDLVARRWGLEEVVERGRCGDFAWR